MESNKLVKLKESYLKYGNMGYGLEDSANEAVKEVFASDMVKPYIYLNSVDLPSHVFYEDRVLFFNTLTIYKK